MVQLVLLGKMFLQLVLLIIFSFIQLGKPAEGNDGECVYVKNKSHSKYSKTRKIITLNTIIDVLVN